MFLAIVLTVLMLAVFYFDVTSYKIPNAVVGLVLLFYPLYLWLSPVPVDWASALMIAGVVFAIGLGLFAAKVMGGGDIKLLVACALWAGSGASLKFFLYTALFGGILALGLMLGRPVMAYYKARLAEDAPMPRILLPGEPLPYGLAIAASMLLITWMGEIPGIQPL
jgi:prepilin peptidase CpaA